MGLFKGRSKAAKGDGQAKLHDPFNRRLRVIKEDDDGSDRSLPSVRVGDGEGKPDRNKRGGNERVGGHRFHRLVEWDYGNENVSYEPPQDFLRLQKKHEQNFFRNGPESSTIVTVNENTELENVVLDQRNTSISSESSSSAPSQSFGETRGEVKIFQFAADSAAILKSISSERSENANNSFDNSFASSGFSSTNSKKSKERIKFEIRSQSSNTSPTRTETTASTGPNTMRPDCGARGKDLGPKSAVIAQRIMPKTSASPTVNRAKLTHLSASSLSSASKSPVRDSVGGKRSGNFATFDKSGHGSTSQNVAENISTEFEKPFDENEILFGENKGYGHYQTFNSSFGQLSVAHGHSDKSPFKNNVNATQKAMVANRKTKKGYDMFDAENGDIHQNKKTTSTAREYANESVRYKNRERKQVELPRDVGSDPDDIFEAGHFDLAPNRRDSSSARSSNIDEALTSITDRIDSIASKRNFSARDTEERSNPFRYGLNENNRPTGPTQSRPAEDGHISAAMLGASRYDKTLKYNALGKANSDDGTIFTKDSILSSVDSYDSYDSTSTAGSSLPYSPKGIRGSFGNLASYSVLGASNNPFHHQQENKDMGSNRAKQGLGVKPQRPPTGVPPSSIMGSMLFRTEKLEGHCKLESPSSRRKRADVPCSVHADELASNSTVSDFTNSTTSEWMIESNKILNCYNRRHQGENSPQKMTQRRKFQEKEQEDLIRFQNLMVGIQAERFKRDQRLQSQAVLSGMMNPEQVKQTGMGPNSVIHGKWTEVDMFEA